MELILKRIARKEKYTIGKLLIKGNTAFYLMDTLEDRDRFYFGEEKIMHETAIPVGRYEIILRYSNRFQRIMPALLNVPQFEGILFHDGGIIADETDTSGCILVGWNKQVGKLINSKRAFNNFLLMCQKFEEKKEKMYITIE